MSAQQDAGIIQTWQEGWYRATTGQGASGKGAEKPAQPLGCQLSHDSPERDTQGREKVTETGTQNQGWWGGKLLQGGAGDPLWTWFLAPTWCL